MPAIEYHQLYQKTLRKAATYVVDELINYVNKELDNDDTVRMLVHQSVYQMLGREGPTSDDDKEWYEAEDRANRTIINMLKGAM